MSPQTRQEPEYLAAIDLGSNSFHMIIGHVSNGNLHVIDRLREMVRLASGLTADNHLTARAKTAALQCLQRFGQRLRDFPPCAVHAVGTNTLRKANRAENFILEAETALGYPIKVISGVEEARLVFLGVAHSLGNHEQKRLVVDIGGGSTELIVGHGFSPDWLESLYMGCVNYSQRFFSDGLISERAMARAEIYAHIELEPIKALVKKTGWEYAIGTSGSIRAMESVIVGFDATARHLTLERLYEIRRLLLDVKSIEHISLKGLKAERAPVFPGGLAILIAVFEALGIEQMEVSSGALREGLLYDQLDRTHNQDIRKTTVGNFIQRFQVDTPQTTRVKKTVHNILQQVQHAWALADTEIQLLITFAVDLHEVGLSIAHSQYHRHGAYLAEHADMAGFSRQEQAFIAALIRSHRRKIHNHLLKELPKPYNQAALGSCVVLRLAILLHRNRSDTPLPNIRFNADKKSLSMVFPDQWLAQNPLTHTDLSMEQTYLKNIKFDLHIA